LFLLSFGHVNQTMNTARPSAMPISRKITHIAQIVVASVLAAACTQTPQQPAKPPAPETARYQAMPFEALPGWSRAALSPSLRTFLNGCPRITGAALSRVCALGQAVPKGDEAAARQFFETAFTPYALVSSEGPDSGLITGYYEPIIDGSRWYNAISRYPIFGVPDDLITVDLASVNPETRNLRLRGRVEGRRLVPYPSRAEIDARGPSYPAPVIAWTADPVALFFLQIQGSGQVRLDGGERIRVGYADQNGHPYRSLGRHLIDRGELLLEQASMQGIKTWAAANPEKLRDALAQNPSYVFFRELPAVDGPIGALNVPLHAERSLAVDRRFVPLGAPVYLATTYPLSETRLERLMAAHDTGGAIRGVVRADFFWGTGPEAGAQAGRMRQQGQLWLLWPIGEPLPAGPAVP
jgi:membrane-bound lytic murein transglycosylase A